MEPDHRSVRARSFGSIAVDYDRSRPGPPEEAVEWALDGVGGLVVELGAGTGGLTTQLAARSEAVIAVEPDPRMHAVLAAHATRASVLTGRAEELPLSSGSADAVLGASMWHWVDPERGPAEVARVLRPGGVFGLVWTGADRSVGWVADLWAVVGSGLSDEERRRRRHEVVLAPGAPFAEPETQLVSGRLSVSGDELSACCAPTAGSSSWRLKRAHSFAARSPTRWPPPGPRGRRPGRAALAVRLLADATARVSRQTPAACATLTRSLPLSFER